MAKSAKSNLNWPNRIIGYAEKPANQFFANPFNPRRHPGAQREALRGILSEVGWVAGVVENVTTGHVIDGHARIEEALSMDENQPIPYLQVRLSENEEKLVLATFDPLGALATYEKAQLDELLRETNTDNAAVRQTLADLAEQQKLQFAEAEARQPCIFSPVYHYDIIFDDAEQFEVFASFLRRLKTSKGSGTIGARIIDWIGKQA